MAGALSNPATVPVPEAEPARQPSHANDNIRWPAAANDNLPQGNTRGKVMTQPRIPGRGNLILEGAILVGRILFDPHVFGDNSAYFADVPTLDEHEAMLVQQGEIDIKQNGMDPSEVRLRVRRDIEAHRNEQAQRREQSESRPEENVRVEGNGCNTLANNIYSKVPEVSSRFQDMMADEFNLYQLTVNPDGSKGSPHPSLPRGTGTWHGHVQQLQQKQKSLRDAIDEYDRAKCQQPRIPRSIRDLAYHPIPKKPGGVPGYPFTSLPR